MAIISSYIIDPSYPVVEKTQGSGSLARLVFNVVWPYRKWLLIIFAAMLLEIAMNLAALWTQRLFLII
jgi:subfamily B ATP-binding cassette protein MsbA